MTTSATNNFETFIKDMSTLDAIVEISKAREDTRSEIKDKAKKNYFDYAYLSGVSNGFIDPAVVDRDHYSDENEAKQHINFALEKTSRDASNNFHANLESILEKVPDETLEKMANIKVIAKAVDPENSEVFAKYHALQQLKNISEKYSRNEDMGENFEKVKIDAASKGFGKELAEKFKDYDKDLQEMARQLAGLSVQRGSISQDKISRYVLEGLDMREKEAKKEYEDSAKAAKTDIYKISKIALKNLSQGSREQFETAKNVLYQVHTGKVKSAPEGSE